MKKRIIAVLAAVMLFVLTSCSQSVVGEWKSHSSVLGVVTETEWTFNEDGTGEKDNVLKVDFTYTVDGDKLQITTDPLGIKLTEEYTFKIKGNKLTLTRNSESIELERVKD